MQRALPLAAVTSGRRVIRLEGWTERDPAGGWVAELPALDVRVCASTPAQAMLECMELARRNLTATRFVPDDASMDWRVDWFRLQAQPSPPCAACGLEPATTCERCSQHSDAGMS